MRSIWVSRLATGMLAGLVFWVSTAAAQVAAPLSVQQQLDDFAVFRGGVPEGHAGRAFFIAPSRFERQCDSVQRTFAASAPVGSYYLKLRYLITLLGHGHTRLSLPTRNAEYQLGGEENGDDVYRNVLCASPSYTVQLPNSQLTLEMPFVCDGQLNRTYPARRLPDYAVQPTIADVLAGRDAELQFVLRQARLAK